MVVCLALFIRLLKVVPIKRKIKAIKVNSSFFIIFECGFGRFNLYYVILIIRKVRYIIL